MRAVRSIEALALAAAAIALAACQAPDVGQPCNMGPTLDPATFNPSTVQSEIVLTFAPECDNLFCILSPVASGEYADCEGDKCGYCSNSCVSDQDCFKSETGLECRQMVLDEAFIRELQQRDPELVRKYLAGLQSSSYCAVPR